jgi:hypothetical protein
MITIIVCMDRWSLAPALCLVLLLAVIVIFCFLFIGIPYLVIEGHI